MKSIRRELRSVSRADLWWNLWAILRGNVEENLEKNLWEKLGGTLWEKLGGNLGKVIREHLKGVL